MSIIAEGLLGRPGLEPPVRYGISHRLLCPHLPADTYLTHLFRSSCQVIQLREKDMDEASLLPLVAVGVELARSSGKIFLVNSAVEAAASRGADGVHLTARQHPGLARAAAAESGRRAFLVGKSVHDREAALRAERDGADYLLLAPVFQPLSKEGTRPLGLDLLRRICSAVSIPVFALGGVTPENSASVVRAGASGFAGISWVHREIGVLEQEEGGAGRGE